jgi:hypothetical protein
MRKKRYTNHVGVLFDDDTYNKLVEITDNAEVSLSEYVRAVVEAELKNEEKENLKDENNRRINQSATGCFSGFCRTDQK